MIMDLDWELDTLMMIEEMSTADLAAYTVDMREWDMQLMIPTTETQNTVCF